LHICEIVKFQNAQFCMVESILLSVFLIIFFWVQLIIMNNKMFLKTYLYVYLNHAWQILKFWSMTLRLFCGLCFLTIYMLRYQKIWLAPRPCMDIKIWETFTIQRQIIPCDSCRLIEESYTIWVHFPYRHLNLISLCDVI